MRIVFDQKSPVSNTVRSAAFRFVDLAIVLRVLHGDQELIVLALTAQPMAITAMRLLLCVGLRGARHNERVALVARPPERVDAGQHRSDRRAWCANR